MGRTSFTSARSAVSMDTEISKLRKLFEKIPDLRPGRNLVYKLSDIFMSGLAMFSLKYASLLDFDQQTPMERANMQSIYGIEKVSSDTRLRCVLDKQSPDPIREDFARSFKDLERTGLLAEYEYNIGQDKYLIFSNDGVQHFSSKKINCTCCLRKKHRNGSTTYHHNMLCSALVKPDKSEVFIVDCEPIVKQDGHTKNDCELNAAKRLISHLEQQYSGYQERYNFVIVEDALYANVPHLRQVQGMKCSFITNVKPGSHKTLFAHFKGRGQRNQTNKDSFKVNQITHRFEWINNVPLNNSDGDFRVNFLHYEQTDKNGKKTTFSWVTNIKLRPNRVWSVMQAARARWKIENETFNTLKNLGYHFEHNYGHGQDHLSTTLAFLMLLAFNVDQFVQACSKEFQELTKKFRTRIRIWDMIRAVFKTICCPSMSFIYQHINSTFQVNSG